MLLTLLTLYIVNSFFHTLAIVVKSDIGKGRRRKQRDKDKDGHSAQTVISCVGYILLLGLFNRRMYVLQPSFN